MAESIRKEDQSDTTSKPASSGWQIALAHSDTDAPDHGYLGNPDVVDGLVRSFMADVLSWQAEVALNEYAQPVASEKAKARAAEMAKVFLGQDSRFESMGEWNSGAQIATFCAERLRDALFNPSGPLDVMTQTFAILVLETYATLRDFNQSGVEDDARSRLDGLAEDWTRMLLGLPENPEEAPRA